MLEMDRSPCTPPTPAGSKPTLTFTDSLGASVTFVPPVALNPLPVADTAEMATFAVPTFVMVSISPVGVPTVTLPKLKLIELAVSWDDAGALAMPVPDKLRASDEFEASLEINSLPCALPVVVGPKFTVIVMVWFGVSVTFDPPLALNPLPVVEAPEMTTFAVPLLVRVTDSADNVPTVTFPNETVVELAVS